MIYECFVFFQWLGDRHKRALLEALEKVKAGKNLVKGSLVVKNYVKPTL